MDVGFETIGNATIICHDSRPVLVTDPWVQGSAYFGSWKLSHEVPPEQLQAVKDAEYVWFSHGHPDHLNGDSLPLFQGKKILLPDHQGRRILTDLTMQGFHVRLLPDRTWVPLSRRIRVMCVPDYNQDAVLLIEVNGRLVFDQNDAGPRGWGRFVQDVIRKSKVTYMLSLAGYGDADMLNYFDESGRRLQPPGAARPPLGQTVAARADAFGARYFIPFSAMHRYQRSDSAWAGEYSASLEDWKRGWNSKKCELLPAFVRVDCERDTVEEIRPKETPDEVKPPESFGDSWAERLEGDEPKKLEAYFKRVEKLSTVMDFITFKVGGQEHHITFNPRGTYKKGLTFEVPRNSLMQSVEWKVFDDLLIGNFMKCTLHGDWGPLRLYPDFTPWIAKYADNGQACTLKELEAYFSAYKKRDPLGYVRDQFESNVLRPFQESAADALRSRLGGDSPLFRAAKKTYWTLRGRA
jgi:hypothetical protein